MTPQELLSAGLRELNLEIASGGQEKLLEFLRLMAQWNRVYNLTAVRSDLQAVSIHLLDSLAVLHKLPDTPLLDVGAGAGLPGIPLAVARPRIPTTMVESNGKKVAFLQHAVARLGLANAHVVHARIEHWEAEPRFAAVISRAFSELARFVQLAGRLIAPGGRLYAMKGRFDAAEAAALPPPWSVLEVAPLRVPGLDAQRHLVIVGKEGS
jgi:16S rRNA (guanine527-N7)-methyltransferase